MEQADVLLRAGGVVMRTDASDQVEVLLVSRRSDAESFTLPAGKYEACADEGRFEHCALRETAEEAGVRCEVLFDLGWYERPAQEPHKAATRSRFFALRALGEVASWAEAPQRQRRWASLPLARQLLAHNEMLVRVLDELQGILHACVLNMDDEASEEPERAAPARAAEAARTPRKLARADSLPDELDALFASGLSLEPSGAPLARGREPATPARVAKRGDPITEEKPGRVLARSSSDSASEYKRQRRLAAAAGL